MNSASVTVIVLLMLFASALHAGDPAPSPFHQSPNRHPAPVVAEVQTDDFSCGYHALAAIYRAHGLDPEHAPRTGNMANTDHTLGRLISRHADFPVAHYPPNSLAIHRIEPRYPAKTPVPDRPPVPHPLSP